MTESRSPYTSSPGEADQYDENGLDPWGFTAAQKHKMLARLAERFASEPDTMSALLHEYRRMESINEESLRQRLGITPEQLTHLNLCLIPREERFADDVRRLAEVSGAPAHLLANIVHQVTFLKALPPRTIKEETTAEAQAQSRGVAFRAMAARDRTDESASLREESQVYDASPKAASAAPAPAPTPADATATDTPATSDEPTSDSPVDPGHEA